MDIRLILAILAGKLIAIANRLTGSGATAAPGLYALKIDPNLVKKLSKKIRNGSIVVSGTNGKTTTSRLTFDILSKNYKIIHNRAGSNLLRGIASTLINHTSITGNLDFDLAIWEVDEAVLPSAIENTSPKNIVLLNLFRDQLDRYGEVDTIRKMWQKSFGELPASSTLFINADDPGIAVLAKNLKNVVFFGVTDKSVNLPNVSQVADVKHCPVCHSNLTFTSQLSSHLGNFKCSNCNFKRPDPTISASNLSFKPDFSTSLTLTVNGQLLSVNYHLPGLYNAYNILAASSVASTYNIPEALLKESIESFSSAFGRYQSVNIGNKSAVIFLIKNPTGANEVLRILALKKKLNLLVLLNDKIADGRDVSWIWDTNWEILKDKVENLSISGIRAWDMATRLKYARFKLSKNTVHKVISYSIQDMLAKLNKGDTLIILPTYTAMLEVQRGLHKMGASSKWHKQ